MAESSYEILEHTADIRIRVKADNLERLFCRSAQAMFEIIAEKKPGPSGGTELVKVSQKAADLEELFINWLNELLSLSSVRRLVFSGFRIKELTETAVSAEVSGGKIRDYVINKEIKAATYHQLKLSKDRCGWKAEVIFDV